MAKKTDNASVYIIGAGPGAPDLITLRGLQAIKKSDCLIIDRLVPETFLQHQGLFLHKKECRRRGEDEDLRSQDLINKYMLRCAREGRSVARIKSGDPHIFGRAMEELEYLQERGVRCEVIPGLSAATAFSALTDAPVTYRQDRVSFAAVTARRAGGEINKDFPKADSLVIFMGVSVIRDITEALISGGRPGDTPAAIFEKVSMPWQKQVNGTLNSITRLARQAGIEAPAILVVGKAAESGKKLPRRPRILFTGLDPGNFRVLGRLMHWPAIRAVQNESDCRKLAETAAGLAEGHFSHVVFTSRTSVRMFFDGIWKLGHDCRILSGTDVTACGAGTSGTLADFGINADIVPRQMGSEGILSAVTGRAGGKVLVLQSATAPEEFANRLAAKLGDVSRLCLHKVIPHPELGKPLPPHDVIYFTSPSGARACWKEYGRSAFEKEVWCIGDVTKKQLQEYGVEAEVMNPYVS